MLSAQISIQEMAMTDARPQLVSDASISRMAALIGAAFLVVTGLVLQLCQFGIGHQTANGFWFMQMVVASIWRLMAFRVNMPELVEVLRFWPLLLIGLGLAILVALKPQSAKE
jgi:hypothetical protein